MDISILLYYDQIGMYYEKIRPQTVGFSWLVFNEILLFTNKKKKKKD